MFACLPLFGLLLPDAATLITGSFNNLSPVRIYIECFLLLFIVLCTLRIAQISKAQNAASTEL
ncbi:hypothetical protein HYN43_014245 [Mucilaginibacter celer]|uniref:Uncharacterized protein n=2 Tax=Mucilaginibacter celer TaxID=2305508 RepID=A0A494VNV8_9SPHI|nr:hypothetical protein HYN43_014245 [Mucilaginibacter celer]